MTSGLSLRSRLALLVGNTAAGLSRRLGKGQGGTLGGTVATRLSPDLLTQLAAGKRVVLISGTNGKSTTTAMTAAALRSLGAVATNVFGDNLPRGLTAALMQSRNAPYAVLEVDEMYMPIVAKATKPAVIVLLNLSRDQLDRVGEIGTVEKRLRTAVESSPSATVVANCDDPLVTSAAWGAKRVEWVAAGAAWKADAASFPRTQTLILYENGGWQVQDSQEYAQPVANWTVTTPDSEGRFQILGPDVAITTKLSLPGRANRGNAAQAAAAATVLGARPEAIGRALASVKDVAGRYRRHNVDGRNVRLLLAKNPAGWQESLTMVNPEAPELVLVTNAQIPDGKDMSWIWDVDFESLRGASINVIVSGERAADLAVRLEYAQVPFTVVPDPLEAIRSAKPGSVEVLANYTAFRDLAGRLRTREQ